MLKKIFFACLTLIIFGNFAFAQTEDANDPSNAILKINAVYCQPNFSRPWIKRSQYQGSGSAVVIEGNRILTNAHNVANATYITVTKQNQGTPITAKLESVDHQCDLAILSVEEEGFFDDITPLKIGKTPPVKTQVLAIGYPIGGDGLSVTQGIISRIELMRYAHSMTDSLLAAQIDAAINSGNSGGPIIYDGKVVGIAFQVVHGRNGLGYMIHSEIIEHFLKDLEDGKVDGFGDFQVRLMGLENPDTRNFYKMKKNQSGILVYKSQKIPNVEMAIMPNDVILSIDGFNIMNNGNIRISDGSNRFFSSVIHSKQMDEKVSVKILRDGKEMELSASPIKYCDKISPQTFDVIPSMFTVGGFVFTPLSWNYIEEAANYERDIDELMENIGKDKESADAEIIVLTEVLGDEVNMGYQGFSDMILEEINGKKILNMKDLANTIDALNEGFVTFKFKNKILMTLDIKKLKDALPRVLQNYSIPADRSKDLSN